MACWLVGEWEKCNDPRASRTDRYMLTRAIAGGKGIRISGLPKDVAATARPPRPPQVRKALASDGYELGSLTVPGDLYRALEAKAAELGSDVNDVRMKAYRTYVADILVVLGEGSRTRSGGVEE
jgi:hypothetical protein